MNVKTEEIKTLHLSFNMEDAVNLNEQLHKFVVGRTMQTDSEISHLCKHLQEFVTGKPQVVHKVVFANLHSEIEQFKASKNE